MASFLRGLYPVAQASSSRRILTALPIRFSSTSAPQAPSSTFRRDLLNPSSTTPSSASRYAVDRDTSPSLSEYSSALTPSNAKGPDAWWSASSTSSSLSKQPGNQYTGRSIRLKGGKGFTLAYRQLMGVLSRTGVRKDVRDSEYFEKPHVRRNRQKSERHRRRFQELIRGKVQMVQAIRNRR